VIGVETEDVGANDSYRSGVFRAVPTATDAVVVGGGRVEAGTCVRRMALLRRLLRRRTRCPGHAGRRPDQKHERRDYNGDARREQGGPFKGP
jgi:hypothetical protein